MDCPSSAGGPPAVAWAPSPSQPMLV